MTTVVHSPEKIEIDRGAGRFPAFAWLHRFGELNVPAPLVVFVSGAQTRRAYERWRQAPRTDISDCLRRALRDEPLPALDALLCPCPVDSEGEGFEWFVSHYDRDLLPRLGRKPTGLGCVGHSAGAAIATHFAVVAKARGAAVLGATGVAERLNKLRPVIESAAAEGWRGFPLLIMRNSEDQTVAPADLAEQIRPPIRAMPRKSLGGMHAFRYYAANECAAGAFLFVLRRLVEDE